MLRLTPQRGFTDTSSQRLFRLPLTWHRAQESVSGSGDRHGWECRVEPAQRVRRSRSPPVAKVAFWLVCLGMGAPIAGHLDHVERHGSTRLQGPSHQTNVDSAASINEFDRSRSLSSTPA
jgi:hypothetical protein